MLPSDLIFITKVWGETEMDKQKKGKRAAYRKIVQDE